MDGGATNINELFSRSLLRRSKNTMESLQIFHALAQIKNLKLHHHHPPSSPQPGNEVRSVTVLGELISQETGLN